MGLTRIRAEQISNSDYKQSVRALADQNITLTSSAPAEVDGVSLSADDRILVIAQSTASENGIYRVETLGTGSNGTWVRSSDANKTGEVLAGMLTMVTEGVEYGDTQWKLITDDPIILDDTALEFRRSGAFEFGNIVANGTAILADTVGDTLTIESGDNISIVGNATAKSMTIGVTGISLNSISNGTSNVSVVTLDGNVTVGIDGTNNVAVFGNTQTTFAGNLIPAANVTYDLGSPTASWKDLYLSGNTIFLGAANLTSSDNTITVGNNLTATELNATGNVTSGNIVTTGQVVATGNISGNFFNGNGTSLSGINVFSNIAVQDGNAVVADSIADTLTLVAGSGIAILADASNDSITIATTGSGESIFATGGDMDTVEETVTQEEDFGEITAAVTETFDLESIVTGGVIYPEQLVLPSFTVAEVGDLDVAPAAQMIFVTDETGGAVPAFSDGANWRRITDRNIVS
jgi:hypothetical protein